MSCVAHTLSISSSEGRLNAAHFCTVEIVTREEGMVAVIVYVQPHARNGYPISCGYTLCYLAIVVTWVLSRFQSLCLAKRFRVILCTAWAVELCSFVTACAS